MTKEVTVTWCFRLRLVPLVRVLSRIRMHVQPADDGSISRDVTR